MTDFVEFKVKLHEHKKVYHTLFLRQHRVREKNEAKPTDRTLFIGGVPPFFNEVSFQIFFLNHNVIIFRGPLRRFLKILGQ